ncbi:MAG TPA: hypothetical protein VII29_10290, partial [Terriglobales bacterium]
TGSNDVCSQVKTGSDRPIVKPTRLTRNGQTLIHPNVLALQLLFLKASESMGNHDSEVVGACSVD